VKNTIFFILVFLFFFIARGNVAQQEWENIIDETFQNVPNTAENIWSFFSLSTLNDKATWGFFDNYSFQTQDGSNGSLFCSGTDFYRDPLKFPYEFKYKPNTYSIAQIHIITALEKKNLSTQFFSKYKIEFGLNIPGIKNTDFIKILYQNRSGSFVEFWKRNSRTEGWITINLDLPIDDYDGGEIRIVFQSDDKDVDYNYGVYIDNVRIMGRRKQIKITGSIIDSMDNRGIEGVVINGLNSVKTDVNGYYESTVQIPWSGTITPNKAGWQFNPVQQKVIEKTINFNQDFAGICKLERVLNISSKTPTSGIPIILSTTDRENNKDGFTPFTRNYNNRTLVNITAPLNYRDYVFKDWTINGNTKSTDNNLSFTLEQSYSLEVEYIYNPIDYHGLVEPYYATNTDIFHANLFYKSSGGVGPEVNSVKIYLNDKQYNLETQDNNWLAGTNFSADLTNLLPGTYDYYFEFTVAGQIFRYPETGTKEINVALDATGWDIIANNLTLNKSTLKAGETFTATGTIQNNSDNPSKIYSNVEYKFSYYDGNGNLLDERKGFTGIINQGKSITVTSNFSIPMDGKYVLNFSIQPDVEAKTKISNNTFSKYIVVGGPGPIEEYYINGKDAWVYLTPGDSHYFEGSDWYLIATNSSRVGIGRDTKVINQQKEINEEYFRFYDKKSIIIVNEVSNKGNAYLSFGVQSDDYVEFENTSMTGYQGDRVSLM
jgi:hypothetical protein